MAIGLSRGESTPDFVMYVDSSSSSREEQKQQRRIGVVATFLALAMVAVVVLVSVQPGSGRVEMAGVKASSSPVAVLETELLKAAPTASVHSSHILLSLVEK